MQKPKLRLTPPPVVGPKESIEALEKLDQWTEEPSNPPPSKPVEAPKKPRKAPTPKEPPAKAPEPAPEPPKKPWEIPSVDATHPYHVILTERLYQKLDFVWKRGGYKSMRELVLFTLEAQADAKLKELGELK